VRSGILVEAASKQKSYCPLCGQFPCAADRGGQICNDGTLGGGEGCDEIIGPKDTIMRLAHDSSGVACLAMKVGPGARLKKRRCRAGNQPAKTPCRVAGGRSIEVPDKGSLPEGRSPTLAGLREALAE
jgi:hypothetical protein